MIRVDRSQFPTPAVLSTKRALSERKRAETFFAALRAAAAAAAAQPTPVPTPAVPARSKKKKGAKDGGNQTAKEKKEQTKFKFAVYKDNEIKALLNQLFKGKCAYCESRYAATQPMDVEHFRPKAEVTDLDSKTKALGYYWLASEWTNLLPSCIDCNRKRYHREEPNGPEVELGKETLFPIAPGSRRALPGERVEDVEKPLLLDPCRDRPEDYLTYVDSVTVPRNDNGTPADVSDRVKASVRVYGLNRTDLVQERRRVMLTARHHFDQIRQIMITLADIDAAPPGSIPPTLTAALENLLSHETSAVLAMADTTAPYSLMVQREIEAFETELGRGLRGPLRP